MVRLGIEPRPSAIYADVLTTILSDLVFKPPLRGEGAIKQLLYYMLDWVVTDVLKVL